MSLRSLIEGLPIPILQAPMVGASSTPMAIAVSQAGGLGAIGAGAMAPDEIAEAAAAVRAATSAPFGINLFVIRQRPVDAAELDQALARLAPWYAELGVPVPQHPSRFGPDLAGQLAATAKARPAIASFTFDILTRDEVAALQAAGSYVVGAATTVAEARAWAAAGADGICAQGAEAGGHRGHFLAETEASLVGTMALVATIRQAVDLPLIAAGGIMDGRGVAAALALGADAVQMGTAFLVSDQTAISVPWRRAIETAGDDPTRLTRAFTGRHARGIENRYMREMRGVENEVPAYPIQNRLTQPLRAAAAAAGEPDMISLWAGQGVRLAQGGDAGELVRRWWREAGEAAQSLAQRTARS
jgi:nitronate monooxygenase